MAAKANFYVVWKGRRTGVFNSWKECEAHVKGFAGAEFKAFPTREIAERAYRSLYEKHVGQSATARQWLFAPNPPVSASICVDAACSGNPGRLEWRAVRTDTGEELFRRGPYQNGTNNIGEFLALVEALQLLKQQGDHAPIYSDSKTAIAWVKKGRCKTDLLQEAHNTPLFNLIARAEAWLGANKATTTPVLKWDTQAWGEIPADFNRK